jgi:hypothetical protein
MNTIPPEMEPTLELAGYFGAHAVGCASDGATLVPMMAVQREDRPSHFDGLMLDLVDYAEPRQSLRMAIPCRSARSADGFAVHPTLSICPDGWELPSSTDGAAFVRGIERHEEGAKVWRERFQRAGV